MAFDLSRLDAQRIRRVLDGEIKDDYTNHFFSHFGGNPDRESQIQRRKWQ